ncbi:MAG: pyridoxamine 5'-phosphate oxidase [Fluviicola sp.]|nr:pyridoxamine 5'-phosphate oxidase [Fluviicola sp.]
MSLEEVKNYMNSIRRDFADRPLNENSVKDNPFEQYATWFEEAVNSQILDPSAMNLSTADAKAKPTSRIVYLRDIIDSGIVFYTNYNSQKGKNLAENPQASATLFWSELERQIRFEGEVEKVADEVSDKYFAARPKESKIGAWASHQSDVLADRKELEEQVKFFTEKFKDTKDIPRPDFWGGYRLIPNRIEFWQGRPSRLHDRIVYLKKDNDWQIVRVNP